MAETTDLGELYRLGDIYKQRLAEKDAAEEASKEAGKRLEAAKADLINAMIMAETTDFIHDDLLYSLGWKTTFRKAAGIDEEQFFRALREVGLGDIIKESVNANTLSSSVRELATDYAIRLAAEAGEKLDAEEVEPVLPEALEPFITGGGFWDVAKPKKPSKTKLALLARAKKSKEG